METKILPITKESLILAKEILLNKGIIGMPTETVYGLAGIGTDSESVKSIYRVKGRPSDNPLIVHVHKDYDITKLCYIDQKYAYDLQKAFLPGPLTMVYNSKGVICKEALAGGDTVAIRVPSHKGCQELLRYVDMPIVAPSANISKHVSPVTAEHVFKDLNGKIELILDGGKCSGGIESTVLDVTSSVPRILRAGLVTREMIKSVVGDCVYAEHKENDRVKSPGVKYSHYMPHCDTARFYDTEIDKALDYYDKNTKEGKSVYFMCDKSIASLCGNRNILCLGETATEIASNLYYKLREGEEKADIIIAIEKNISGGVYDGILNRLNKACKKI